MYKKIDQYHIVFKKIRLIIFIIIISASIIPYNFQHYIILFTTLSPFIDYLILDNKKFEYVLYHHSLLFFSCIMYFFYDIYPNIKKIAQYLSFCEILGLFYSISEIFELNKTITIVLMIIIILCIRLPIFVYIITFSFQDEIILFLILNLISSLGEEYLFL